MKKSLLLILASLFAIFALAGCAEEEKNDTPATTPNTPVDLTKPETLNGNYEVTFFGSQVTNAPAGMEMFLSAAYISNDCVKAAELYPDVINQSGLNQCNSESQATLLDGKVVITVANNEMNITSRMQMEGGIVELSPVDKYQFTKYYTTKDLTRFSGKGVTGWNYDDVNNAPSAASTEFPESPFEVTKLDDGSIRIDMTLVGKSVLGMAIVNAKNTIILKKVNDDTTALANAIQKPFTPAEPAN